MHAIEQNARFEMTLPPGQRPIDITCENMGVMQIHTGFRRAGEKAGLNWVLLASGQNRS